MFQEARKVHWCGDSQARKTQNIFCAIIVDIKDVYYIEWESYRRICYSLLLTRHI
jgi:hypothetical protein